MPFTQNTGLEIAVIGMAGRFPGAKNLNDFWDNLQKGVESISFFTDEELLASGIDPDVLSQPNYVKASGVLKDIELFDASFFDFDSKEAEITDPQHRFFLECAWEALENAGYDSLSYKGSIGTYAGTGSNRYLVNLYSNQNITSSLSNLEISIGNDRDFLTTRVSYKLNLEGPSYTVQTACSTSLVAVHLACQSLLGGECDMALAGGVSINLYQKEGYFYQDGGITSPDGHCRTFDAKAKGTIGGDGVGIVVLKRLEDALTDGDNIYAVIKGSAVNNDGSFKLSYTAPRIDGQAKVIRAAQLTAEVEPETITYVEAHGTATPLGDPIEVAALTQVFSLHTDKKHFCALGSVKTNVGHLNTAAGVAGLIKTVLALKHGLLPPSLHFEEPNPQIDFDNSPFYVNTELSQWKVNNGPRRAGVSSFGIGGTNAHVILEEAPVDIRQNIELCQSRPWQLLVLSAKTSSALENVTVNLTTHLKHNPTLNLADVAHVLQVGRRPFNHRRIVVCQNLNDAVQALDPPNPQRVLTNFQEPGDRPVVFIFPQEDVLCVNKTLELYHYEPTFRQSVDSCFEIIKSYQELDLRTVLYPNPEQAEKATYLLEQTQISQLALFVIEYALAQLWLSWGIRPQSMIGYSTGEYVAATLAGVFSLENALAQIAARGQLLQQMPFLKHDIRQIEKIELNPPQIPLISYVSGTWLTTTEATDPSYWSKRLKQTANFADGIAELIKEPNAILLEVGSKGTLSALAYTHQKDKPTALSSLPHPKDQQSDIAFLLTTLGQLWLLGVQVDWSGFYAHEQRSRIPLPTYPFERQRYWIDQQPDIVPVTTQVIHKKSNIADWFYIPSWKQSKLIEPFEEEKTQAQKICWLVFVDACGLGKELVTRLEQQKHDLITVFVGKQFAKLSDNAYIINPQRQDDYEALIQQLRQLDRIPQAIAHFWNVTSYDQSYLADRDFENSQYLGFYSLLFLTQALDKQNITYPLQIITVTNNLHEVTGEESLNPEKATLLGPCKVIGQEYPNIFCRSVDVVIPKSTTENEKLIDYLIEEFTTKTDDLIVAYRGHHRWVQTWEPVQLGAVIEEKTRFRNRGVYLITGGLGNIGFTFAKYLAKAFKAKLILLGRSDLPIKENFSEWIATHGEQDTVSRQIQKVKALEELGAEVLVISADVANFEQMQVAIAQADEYFGKINGVIHAAGIVGDNSFKLIQEIGKAECEMHFQSKVHGLFVLQKLLHSRELDFCLLLSSISSILGGLGFVAYSAANLYMDAFTYQQNRTKTVPWISLNWEGSPVDKEEQQNTNNQSTLAELFITTTESVEVFKRVFSIKKLSQIAISLGELQARINQWLKLESIRDVEPSKQDTERSVQKDSPQLRPRANLQTAYVPPRTPVEFVVANLWQQLLNIERVGIYDNYFELGGHSLVAVRLMAQIQRKFGQNIPLAALFQAPTVEKLASVLQETTDSRPWSPLVEIQPRGSKRPFFCLPGGGGNVLYFYQLANYLGLDQPFYALQASGLDGKTPAHTSIEDMAADYIKAIQVVQPEGPYLLGGHSFGGRVAFEIALQLQQLGQEVAVLAIFDTWAPIPDQKPVEVHKDDTQYLIEMVNMIEGFFSKNLFITEDTLRKLMPDEQLNYFLAQLKTAEILPPQATLEQVDGFLKVYKANTKANCAYMPKEAYHNQVTVFHAQEELFDNPSMGWDKYSLKSVETYEVPGEHITMMAEPHVQVLAKHLKVCLEQAQANG
ncbi:beta-ketoacyl synthase family protein,acyltransferase family protein,phosphopantetheine-containing protein (plasmid) [Cylindrospermum stagnale PCC 7417]|uniref:Phenolphthiocerol/phthiocerol polyketide synthase subunit E n=2 Tax=Cylindrospermum stagnale TaxID=142864 RepID=K9X6G3_9NOST|nr:beta-ketoacyl synthase family protein,acyltransferase family protein,phosphopantetheine-containing protein [Cylindrospermum stagnale PCC 7417]